MNRKCSTCGKIKSLDEFYRNRTLKLGRTYTCKECTDKVNSNFFKKIKGTETATKYSEAWRKKRLATAEGRKRYEASVQARYAVRKGRMKIEKVCTACGSTKNIEMHHEDYDKPLEVIVLCRECHRALHLKETK